MELIENSGYAVYGCPSLSIPLLVSVPHAGRDYPDKVFRSMRLPKESLVRLEDRYADLLLRKVIGFGFPAIVAHRARAWIDLNRAENDIDVEMVRDAIPADYPPPGAKQRGGLGLIPRRLTDEGDIWKGQFDLDDIQGRITSFHQPYHATIADILQQMHKKFGIALLLDVHSMPPIRNVPKGGPPHFVVGDRFGQSSASLFSELLIQQIQLAGFRTALNHPYSGEHILRRHGKPKGNIHALQLEVDRSLYLDSTLREPSILLPSMSALIGNLVRSLSDQALGSATLIAAE
ncbi:MAG: N-formylglutamate amidohydrolase [Sphingorhabdus sp.]|uniref:N-formylglutamate amidohydrolase n=1 Tax=Sphingorhabdus sp. TaxID=1902408 RepID=UPI0038FCDFEC